MKMAKRILSLVLVLVMFASLSVTAFADTPATPYINVTVRNSRSGATPSWTVAATTGASVKSALDADTAHAIEWDNTVQDYYDHSKLHSALVSYAGFGSTGFNKVYAEDVTNLKAAGKGYDDAAIEEIDWCSGIYQGYGLVDHDEAAGTYTYIYAGYDWTYTNADGGEIWDYMCCYNVSADEVIHLTYGFTVTDPWVRTAPLGENG